MVLIYLPLSPRPNLFNLFYFCLYTSDNSSEKPIKCTKCEKRLARLDLLNEHEEIDHNKSDHSRE